MQKRKLFHLRNNKKKIDKKNKNARSMINLNFNYNNNYVKNKNKLENNKIKFNKCKTKNNIKLKKVKNTVMNKTKNINMNKHLIKKYKNNQNQKLLIQKNKEIDKIIKNNNYNYNDSEMNSLNYDEAKKLDKRNYCQYYMSLLRTNHILIFSFCQNKDYNSKIIKIYIFFLTFTINYLISAMFYSDDTMHKIYEDKGNFDFTYQLPQMFYSFIISTILQTLLNFLGLFEQNIITYKNNNKTNKLKRKLLFIIKFKIIIFFIITYVLLAFIWVYLGCFCAVYKNTQIHLLIDVSSSFAISLLTPFFIYLLPGIFRISSLKTNTKRPVMYKFSQLLQLL